MIYTTLKRYINQGNLDNIQDKLDVFYANDRITKEQYEELCELLRLKLAEDDT